MITRVLDTCLGDGDIICGGKIAPVRKDGRFYEFKNVLINLPESLIIPRCNRCQKDHLDPEMEIIVNNTLSLEYNRHEDLIEAAIARHQNG